ncbi:type VI secretion system baseplate subunit TssE [Marinobacter persicus]|jgi:type VI secretion system protein ImpF|uniref:Type VI secretion system protein ImpF n=1 Tax=Marinobacter persicus TaxID=930118 RepID=A0A2S6G508_9GAMM|nr:type VI secretion system baseplate subunit TssE [Marinobacter persicus]PPK50849.1 type VI secretion system protein ImpF [Marinobacter persicus]PPK54163.1 type VI secretion system protein ImpF [Marinobacter persicus]PPK57439.1 type VI secretion system protein ImpF [Marinobacter persicus]
MSDAMQMVPTLLDRLLDDNPSQMTEALPGHLCSTTHYKASVVRDLELLVNTRRELVGSELDAWPSLQGTLLAFGLPDFLSRGVRSTEDRQVIQRQLERTIEHGDKRFSSVRVHLLNPDTHDRILQFRIEAMLTLSEAQQHVAFDAVLQVNTRQYKVQNLV